ncbi:MAG: TerC family protein [Betaproteobacteria bacterium]|nr:TerC family protein [Betaproteobacteria bacterium]
MNPSDPEFWVAVLKIVGIDIVLGGDNAVVIALAARSLPPHQKKLAIFWGTGAAIVLRLVLIFIALELLRIPFLKLAGGLLLLWIGMKLMLDEDGSEHAISAGAGLMAAIRTIVIADAVMSVDNVIAVAAAAKDSFALAMFGIALSIPIIVFTSQLLLKFMERFPIIIVLGAALLGFVAGEMMWNDPAVKPWTGAYPAWLQYLAGAIGSIVVVMWGRWVNARRRTAAAAKQAAGPV